MTNGLHGARAVRWIRDTIIPSPASQRPGMLEPVDVIYGKERDLRDKKSVERILGVADGFGPDLVVITPPCICGPWSAWQRMRAGFTELDRLRKWHRPFWRLARQIWDKQTRGGGLAVTEQPEQSEALELSYVYMTGREDLYRVVVDQCEFGLKDPVSHKFYRKATALDVNNEKLATALAWTSRCTHRPEEHEQIQGSVFWQGRWQKRSALAAAGHILKALKEGRNPEHRLLILINRNHQFSIDIEFNRFY